MSAVLNPPRSSPVGNRQPAILVALGLLGAVIALVFLADWLTPSPSFVDRITVVNPTVYHLEIDVTGAGRHLSIGLGPIGRETTKSYGGVIDQGREWIFRFSSGPASGGELRIPRDQLQRDGWGFTVPDDVARRLQAAGIPPSLPD